MQHSTIQLILDYVWVPIVTVLVVLWQKFTGQANRISLLEQAQKYFEQQRQENRKLRDAQRDEILKKIDNHHATVMGKLDSVETRIKNGHG